MSELAARWPQHTIRGRQRARSRRSWRPAPQTPDDARLSAVHVRKHRHAEGRDGDARERRRTSCGPPSSATASRPTTASRSCSIPRSTCRCSTCSWPGSRAPASAVRRATTLWNPGGVHPRQQLTVWFSVPSLAMLMNRLGALKPGAYPIAALEPVLRRTSARRISDAPGPPRRRVRLSRTSTGPPS